jgi:hypothetical protein
MGKIPHVFRPAPDQTALMGRWRPRRWRLTVFSGAFLGPTVVVGFWNPGSGSSGIGNYGASNSGLGNSGDSDSGAFNTSNNQSGVFKGDDG